MEMLLKQELGYSSVKASGHSGGGCISQGQSYDTDRGRVFVKVNSKAEVGARRWLGVGSLAGAERGPGLGPGRYLRSPAGQGSGSGLGPAGSRRDSVCRDRRWPLPTRDRHSPAVSPWPRASLPLPAAAAVGSRVRAWCARLRCPLYAWLVLRNVRAHAFIWSLF